MCSDWPLGCASVGLIVIAFSVLAFVLFAWIVARGPRDCPICFEPGGTVPHEGYWYHEDCYELSRG